MVTKSSPPPCYPPDLPEFNPLAVFHEKSHLSAFCQFGFLTSLYLFRILPSLTLTHPLKENVKFAPDKFLYHHHHCHYRCFFVDLGFLLIVDFNFQRDSSSSNNFPSPVRSPNQMPLSDKREPWKLQLT